MGLRVELKNYQGLNQSRREILKLIDRICQEQSLEYFAFAKLMAGAVYFHDFIPNGFDSSTEIGLMRKDYERLIPILDECAGEYELTVSSEYKHGTPGFQCTVKKPLFMQYGDMDFEGSTEVIISAFDFVPEDEEQRTAFYQQVKEKRETYIRMAKKFSGFAGTSIKPKAILKRMKQKITYGHDRMQKDYQELMQLVSSCPESTVVRRLVPSWSQEVPYEDIFPVNRVDFQDMQLSLPNNQSYWELDLQPIFQNCFREMTPIAADNHDAMILLTHTDEEHNNLSKHFLWINNGEELVYGTVEEVMRELERFIK